MGDSGDSPNLIEFAVEADLTALARAARRVR
jgi:hypothetical protein